MEIGFQNKSASYGKVVNSYDLLKFIAIVTMVIDHVGHYFYPDMLMYRMVGRIALPCFLFLVGYSGKWQSKADIFIMALLLAAVEISTNGPILPVNILFTIIASRYLMAAFEKKDYLKDRPYSCAMLAMAWAIPTMFLFQYGTGAALYALLGYYVKTWGRARKTAYFAALVTAVYFAYQFLFIEMAGAEPIACAIALVSVGVGLYYFKMAELITKPGIINFVTRFIGRNSLYIYIIHVIIFRLIAIHYFSWGEDHLVIFHEAK